MRPLFFKAAIALAVCLSMFSNAEAGGRWVVGIGIGVGPPVYRPYYPYYGPYPYYYGPPVIIAPPILMAPPPVLLAPPTIVPQVTASPAPTVVVPQTAAYPSGPPLPAIQLPEPPKLSTTVYEGTSNASQPLQRLKDSNERVRIEAAMTLGRGKDQQAVGPLVRILREDKSPTMREAAARSLGLIGSQSALSALQTAAQGDDDAEVRHSARFAAEGIRGNLPK